MVEQNKFLRGIFFIMIFFAVVLFCFLLKIMDSFFKPVVLSVLLSFVFYPFIKTLNNKTKLPWWVSIFVVYIIFFIVLFLIMNLLGSSFKSIVFSIPKYQEKFQEIVENLKLTFSSDSRVFKFLDFNEEDSLFVNLNNQFNILEYLRLIAVNFTTSIVGFMKALFLVVLLSVFLLAEFKKTRRKVNLAFDGNNNLRVVHVVQNIISDTTHYASIKFVISLMTGVLVFLACLLTRLDFALIWGFLAFCLNFIPTFGSIASSLIIIVFAIIQFYPSWIATLFLSLWIVAVNFVLGNVVEPKIEGENLGISPFVILVALSFAGWIWGVLGMILAVPMLVIVKIICENISFLKPVAVFLGNKTE